MSNPSSKHFRACALKSNVLVKYLLYFFLQILCWKLKNSLSEMHEGITGRNSWNNLRWECLVINGRIGWRNPRWECQEESAMRMHVEIPYGNHWRKPQWKCQEGQPLEASLDESIVETPGEISGGNS